MRRLECRCPAGPPIIPSNLTERPEEYMHADELLANRAELFPHGLPPTGNLIGGRRLTGGAEFPVHDRYLQVKVASVASATREQVAHAVMTARGAVGHAPAPYDRARILRRVAEAIDQRRQAFIDLMIAEVG